MDTRLFEKRLYDAARPYFPRGAIILCGVSGGIDSMALLHGLHRVNNSRRCGWHLHVAHLDHNIPHDAAEMMAFVRVIAASLGLPFTSGREDVVDLSRRTSESIETSGRRVRYAFLECVARDIGAKSIAVAHHADDQAETVLHRIVRGTGLRGLTGMTAQRALRDNSDINIVRPLLGFRRDDLAAYLRKRMLAFHHDVTNDDPHAATRNRYRGVVIPLLEKTMNPKVVDALIRLAEQAQRAQAVIDRLVAQVTAELVVHEGPDGMTLAAPPLAVLEPAVQSEVIRTLLEKMAVPLGEMSFERIEAVAAACRGDGRKRRVELPGKFVAERRGRFLRIFRASKSKADCRVVSGETNKRAMTQREVADLTTNEVAT